jgi:16S rRNA (guanine527-N7)-methyltransferase
MMSEAEARGLLLSRFAVSRETEAALERYSDLLRKWQDAKNLVGPATLDRLWLRHFLDSAQLVPLLGAARSIVDLGSGAGFPGLVIALIHGRTGVEIELVESNQRKAAFLAEAIRVTHAPAILRAQRIEDYVKQRSQGIDIVTARALAPLDRLLELADPLLKTGARALFMKGRDVEQELTQAQRSWRLDSDLVPSLTDESARIVVVRGAHRIGEAAGTEEAHD